MPYGIVDKVAKMVPSNPAAPVSICQALKSEADLCRLNDEDEQVAHLIATARKLEGLYRHVSTHAAGWLSPTDPCQSWCRFIAIHARICLLPSLI